MKLEIELDTFYIDGMRLCFVGAANELPKGTYSVSTIFSHEHGCELPNALGLGWIGPSNKQGAADTDVVLGRVRDGKVIHCHSFVVKLLAMLETAEDRGESTVLTIV